MAGKCRGTSTAGEQSGNTAHNLPVGVVEPVEQTAAAKCQVKDGADGRTVVVTQAGGSGRRREGTSRRRCRVPETFTLFTENTAAALELPRDAADSAALGHVGVSHGAVRVRCRARRPAGERLGAGAWP